MGKTWLGHLVRFSDPLARDELRRAIDHRVAAALCMARALLETAAFLREQEVAPRALPPLRARHERGESLP